MGAPLSRLEQRILLFAVFFLSLCGIIYELVLGSLATYLLGNPVQQYSITIGFFLSSMGLGSWLSRFIIRRMLRNFVFIEAILGLVGGLSIILLSYFFSFSGSYYMLHIFFLVIVGTLVGLEIPLIMRVLREYGALKDILSNILSLDYLGGLAGSLLFPLLLFPVLGRMLTSIIVGCVNIAVALFIMARIDYEGKRRSDLVLPVLAILLLGALAVNSEQVNTVLQKRLYYDDIVFNKRSRYQEIVLTRNGNDFRLYLDGSLQFSSHDEYRYHEMLVFPALALRAGSELDVIVLGGGDGCAVREALRSNRVRSVTLVDLDQAIIDLARRNPSFRRINGGSLSDPRVATVVNDAYKYLRETHRRFDVIIADFPDPHDETIAKLYTVEFFRLAHKRLLPGGILITQSTSPFYAGEAFWCINKTMKEVFPAVIPYHVYIPSFGDWGFNLAVNGPVPSEPAGDMPFALRYYSGDSFKQALHFPRDSIVGDMQVNTFNRPVLYRYYINGWKHYTEY